MSEWQKVKIGQFLKVRQGKYKPDDATIADLKRLSKIDFSGYIHLSDKPTKTDMIIVNSGDLVISGINVAKGAIAIHQGDQPITATIHYSSYQFDDSIIDIDFLKRFLRSPAFIFALNEQVKGGIKTEIKAKTLLSIVVQLPSLPEQKAINRCFQSFENELVQLASEINNQKTYLTKLRQAILQEAIEGKLTADWRVKNPVRQGDTNIDAAALLATIKAEKQKLIAEGKLRKEKPLAPINPDDVPFALPDGWVWVRLGEIIRESPKNGYSPKEVTYRTEVKSLKLGATTLGIFNPNKFKYIDEDIPKDSKLWLEKNDILIQRSNSIDYVGVSAIYTGEKHQFIYPDLMMKIQIFSPSSPYFTYLSLSTITTRSYFRSLAKGSQKNMPKINQEVILNTIIAFPPLAEQHAIVERIDCLMNYVNALESQGSERKSYAEQLMQTVLKEAFAG